MRAPRFWQKRPGLRAALLWPAGAIYGAVTARRMAQPGERIGKPVISIGNFTAGGAGKTPVAAEVARLIALRALRPYIVSRGYGGREAGPLRVDPEKHTAAEVGDEPAMLAPDWHVVVARDRVAGAKLALAEGADAIVLDDGLQNPALAKDLSIAVVDGATGVGNGFCLPAGPLRAPLARQLGFVDALIVLGMGKAGDAVAALAAERGLPVLRGRLAPDAEVAEKLKGRRVLGFAGIGRPRKFWRTLMDIGADVFDFEEFPDHYPFNDKELAELAAAAAAQKLAPVTTEKDAARIGAAAIAKHFGEGLVVLPVRVEMEDAGLGEMVGSVLGKGGAAGAVFPREGEPAGGAG